jgi:preprotein translocase subunit SecY
MFQTLRNAWKIEDLRKKMLFTIFIILIFRIGSAVTVPFVDGSALAGLLGGEGSTTSNYLMMMSGGGFSTGSIFALSITPYINASIIIQLLTVAIPYLERLSKDGEAGRKKLGQITRYTTVILGLILAVAYYLLARNRGALVYEATVPGFGAWFAAIVIILCFTAGSALMMWLGEQINEKGIGNGISILLFAGILSRIPTAASYLWGYFYTMGLQQLKAGGGAQSVGWMLKAILVVVLFLAMVAFIVFMGDAERRIPVQYAKKVVGRKMYGGQNTYIPIKVNMSGVMPIILAVSILGLPGIISSFMAVVPTTGFWGWFFSAFREDSWLYIILYFLMIIGFAFFYVTIQYNPIEMANNLRKNGGAVPGQRPGKPTSDYIKRVLNKVTFVGALFLGVIALFPSLFGKFSGVYGLTIGGTSMMIVVGVALETVQQIESQMMMRHYKGFLD